MDLHPLVSVIIPTRESEKQLLACLSSVKSQTYKNIEIIVVDNYSTDKTRHVARKFTGNVYKKAPERSAQRNFGAKKAKGEYLLFIDSDMILSPGVIKECVGKILKDGGTYALIIPEESTGNGFWAKCKKLERSFYLGIDWIEAARFFPQKIFNRVKGYDEMLVSGEDWDLSQRIRKIGRIGRIKNYIYHNEFHLSLLDTLKSKFYYARRFYIYSQKHSDDYFCRKQINPLERYYLFFRDPVKLLHNPLTGVGMIFMKTCEFGIGIIGNIFRYKNVLIERKNTRGRKKIRIAFFITTFLEYGGGIEHRFIQMASKISSFKGYQADIVTMDEKISERIFRLMGIYYFRDFSKKVIYKDTEKDIRQNLGKTKYYKISSLKELKETLYKYDIIYSKNEILESMIHKLLIGFDCLPPVIYGCHTTIHYPKPESIHARFHNFLYNSFIYRYLASGVKRFIVLNPEDEHYIKKNFPGESITTVKNIFSLAELRGKSDKYKLGDYFDKNKYNILWVGRFSQQKGIDDLTEIIETINNTQGGNRIIWNIAGEGEERDKIIRLVKNNKNVRYLGYIRNNFMPYLYRQNNLFISTSKWESFGNSILEAQVMGLPVIAYDIPGPRHIIIPGLTGYLVKDISQFISVIIDFIEKKKMLKNISKISAKRIHPKEDYRILLRIFKEETIKN